MTRKFNTKKDAAVIRPLKGETPAMLKLRLMMNVLGHHESNGMSRIYTIWSKNNR